MAEQVNHPAHYGGENNPYETIKVLEAWEIKDPMIWQVIKYCSRAGKKEGNSELQDLRKAQFYLNRKIQLLENE